MTTEMSTPVPSTAVPVTPAVEASQQAVKAPVVEKVKVNGKEIEVPLDELKRAYGLHTAAQSKFEEAARLRKEAEQVKSVFSQKDVNTLLKAGWTEDEIEQKAAEWLVKKAQEKVMTPEQRAAKQREEEYYRLKQAEEDRIKAEKDKIKNELTQKEAKLYQTAFLSELAELDKKSPLDLKDPVILSHIINDITTALNKHGYDMGVHEAVKRLEEKFIEKRGPVKKEYLRKLLKNTITDVDDSDLEAFLEKGAKGIREKSVEALKRNEAPFAKPRSQTQSQEPERVKKDLKYYRDLRYGRIKP